MLYSYDKSRQRPIQTLLGNPLHGGPKLLGGPKLPGRVYYGATMADQLCHGAMVPWYYHGT